LQFYHFRNKKTNLTGSVLGVHYTFKIACDLVHILEGNGVDINKGDI
jgi:hypothetical protein